MKPYIGVTDFVTRAQVEQAKAAIPASVHRRLHVGAMTSYKVLNGIPTSLGWENVWLNERGLHDLFANDRDVYNVIHYADYGHRSGSRAPTSVLDLVKAWDMSGPYVDAMQLDMVWPKPSLLEEFLQCRPDAEFILQVSSEAIRQGGDRWFNLLPAYHDHVQYMLIDTGMGRGTMFEPLEILTMIDRVVEVVGQNRVAVAGGLGPETYRNLELLFDEYPLLSCDAQSRLRPSRNALDPLDIGYVEQYIKGVCSLLEK